MLRFLVFPDHNSTSMTSKANNANRTLTQAERELTLELVHAVRREESDEATKLLASNANREVFARWSEVCGLAEFDRMARVNRPNKAQLGKLLQIELQIINKGKTSATPQTRRLDWGDYATQSAVNLGVLPSFENVTSFDPTKTIYRDGVWVQPRRNNTSPSK